MYGADENHPILKYINQFWKKFLDMRNKVKKIICYYMFFNNLCHLFIKQVVLIDNVYIILYNRHCIEHCSYKYIKIIMLQLEHNPKI